MAIAKQKENKINNEIALLPMATIIMATELQEDCILAYEQAGIIKSLKRNEKKYYSICDLEKLKFASLLVKSKIMEFSGVVILFSLLAKTNIEPSGYLKYTEKIIKTKNLKIS